MIVEFVGPAAAGKSTTRREVEAGLVAGSVKVLTVGAAPQAKLRTLRGLLSQLLSVLSQPRLAAWSLRNLGDKRRQTRLLTMLQRSDNVRRGLRHSSGADVIFIDEGPWRVVPRLIGEGVVNEDRLLALLPWPDAFVFVNADVEETVRRHYDRGKGLARRPPEQMRANHRDQVRGLASVLTHRASIEVDTTHRQGDEVVEPVIEFVLKQLQTSTRDEEFDLRGE